jgi:hypothetical protein
MFFLLPLLPAFAAATVSIGEAIGIGASLVGIGTAIKGTVDFHEAKSIQENTYAEYHNKVFLIQRKAELLQQKLEAFGRLKLQTYTGIIREAVEILSRFKQVDLSAFRDIQIENIAFINSEFDTLKTSCIKASDVLSCLSIGVNTAVCDRIQYKNTPPLIRAIGAFGFKPQTAVRLPDISYAAITLAGFSWGISGINAKIQSETSAIQVSCEIEKMESVLTGFKALAARIAEGEKLLSGLTDRLRLVLMELKLLPGSPEVEKKIDSAISLTRALKQIIETDICTGNGLLTPESGVLFRSIQKEYAHV